MRKIVILALFCWLGLLLLGSRALASSSGASSSTSSSPSSTSSSSKQMSQPRQSAVSVAASLVGAIGSLVPNLITNVAPLLVLVGIGALMMPALGMGAMGLLREARRSASDQTILPNMALPAAFAQYARPLQTSPQDLYYFTKRSFPSLMSNINTQAIMRGLQDVFERVAIAIDNADKRYN